MGCGNSTPTIDFQDPTLMVQEKQKIIEELEASNKMPSEEQRKKVIRLDIDISEQIENITNMIKDKNTKANRIELDKIIITFNDLVIRWKKIMKEDDEEVQLLMKNEEKKENK